jgi:hypothetical protein
MHSCAKSVGDVLRIRDLSSGHLASLLATYGLNIVLQPCNEKITGSFWGDDEAGLVLNKLYLRDDTPVHSALHEACHFICMDDERRKTLHTNAGGDSHEENAVCYLQILLSAKLAEMGQRRMLDDMDIWGYNFRLGSAEAWFNHDAEDARLWLQQHGLLGEALSANQ